MKKRPSAQILCVGTELLLGNVLDTNSHTVSVGLAELGINLYYRKTVGDNLDRLVFSIREAIDTSDILILSGGLGSTVDDLTLEGVGIAMDIPLEYHMPTLEKIEAYYRRKGVVMTENNKKQALLPKGAIVLENRQGMAPGTITEKNGKLIIALPGPPRELGPMFREDVMPYLAKRYGASVIVSRMVRFWGLAESAMDEKVKDLTALESPTVAPYAKNGESMLRVSARGESEAECLAQIEPVVDEIKNRLGDYFWTDFEDTFEEALVHELRASGKKISFAESCTGGLCAKRVTDVSGASSVIDMSVVTYAASAKQRLVGVRAKTVEEFGVISAECAEEMAQGIRELSGADIGVSVTGLVGPTPDEGKPVGLVFVGVSTPDKTYTKRYFFPYENDRAHVRLLASSACLAEALFTLRGKE
ncbi:MAG: competence/damage-inducible protein A [Clostridia bacterium]|nr:competence/damage-inducible protein A [Clostridia bacterium]